MAKIKDTDEVVPRSEISWGEDFKAVAGRCATATPGPSWTYCFLDTTTVGQWPGKRETMDKIANLMNMSVIAGAASDAFYELHETTETLEKVRKAIAWEHMPNENLISRAQLLSDMFDKLQKLLDLLDKIEGDSRVANALMENRIQFHIMRLSTKVAEKKAAVKAEKKATKAGPKPGR